MLIISSHNVCTISTCDVYERFVENSLKRIIQMCLTLVHYSSHGGHVIGQMSLLGRPHHVDD